MRLIMQLIDIALVEFRPIVAQSPGHPSPRRKSLYTSKLLPLDIDTYNQTLAHFLSVSIAPLDSLPAPQSRQSVAPTARAGCLPGGCRGACELPRRQGPVDNPLSIAFKTVPYWHGLDRIPEPECRAASSGGDAARKRAGAGLADYSQPAVRYHAAVAFSPSRVSILGRQISNGTRAPRLTTQSG